MLFTTNTPLQHVTDIHIHYCVPGWDGDLSLQVKCDSACWDYPAASRDSCGAEQSGTNVTGKIISLSEFCM